MKLITNLNRFSTLILILTLLFESNYSQIAMTDLTKIGVIPARNYALKIKGSISAQPMVIKLVPSINNITQCDGYASALQDYKALLTRILKPINDSLSLVRSTINERTTGVRFWGAIIGGVALGVATSAQITAAIALHKANQNANMIKNMKDAILNTNRAIEKLQDATRGTVLAISGLQEQINSNVVPALNLLGCEVAINTLKLNLNRYFSEISFVFGPNLRDPSSQTLSIQAVSQAFNGDFESMLKELNYRRDDFLDLIQSDAIRGRIIDVDLENYFVSLQIEYPELITIKDSIVQEFNIISHNDKGSEWMAMFPRAILKRGLFLSNIDLKDCSRTDTSYICQEDTSTPMSPTLFSCMTGDLENCARTRVVNAHVSRYALSGGVVFANCVPITCICIKTNQHLIQDSTASNVMITQSDCQELQIDGMYITVGPKKLNRSMYSRDIKFGPPISSNPIDVRNQLAKVEESIKDSESFLRESYNILRRINPNVVNTGIIVFLIIASVVVLVWCIGITVWLWVINQRVKQDLYLYSRNQNMSTVSSMSSLIPGA
ncbi:fusion protein [Shaan virus]|uniref:Fusion glycoprotein F0 n=2 Tax=Parajeilongvirus TaxID=3153023 RepID=A0A346NTM3_9MONO|nr:fusion protein [Bat paramyxovirus]AXR70616.1 fusion protein [Shaan virus]